MKLFVIRPDTKLEPVQKDGSSLCYESRKQGFAEIILVSDEKIFLLRYHISLLTNRKYIDGVSCI